LLKSLSYCRKKISSGQKRGGKTLACPSLIKEAEIIHIKGIKVISEVTDKNKYNNIFFIVRSYFEF